MIKPMYKYKAMNKIQLIFFLLIIYSASLYAQTGSVSISENSEDTPHESAILDIKSDSKGILIPRMTYNSMCNIDPKEDGLLVYVTSPEQKGLWNWSDSEQKWIQLRGDDSGEQDVVAPPGAIMLYSGETDGYFDVNGKGIAGLKMDGWQICNGCVGQPYSCPDLTAMFVASINDNENCGIGVGVNELYLTEEQMVEHTHDMQSVTGKISDHEHGPVNEQPHYHTYTTELKKSSSNRYLRIIKKGSSVTKQSEKTWLENFEIKPAGASKMIKYPVDFLDNTGGGKEIDNRPSFYTVLYIIKL